MPLPDHVVRFSFQGPRVEYVFVFVHAQSLLQPNDKNHIIFLLPGIPAGRFDFIFASFTIAVSAISTSTQIKSR